MPRIDEVKKQNPHFNLTYIDLFKRVDTSKTGKYIPLMCVVANELYNRRISDYNYNDDLKLRLDRIGFNYDNLNNYEIMTSLYMLEHIMGQDMELVKSFIELNERGFIENKDVLSYKDISQIRNEVSKSELKLCSKELESQVQKEFENETWIAIRPLSFEASSKYGSSTKWCTTYKQEKEYFAKYFSRGVLVYFINKVTGYKFALYSEVYDTSSNDITFWSADDNRMDFLQLDIDSYLLPVIKNLVNSKVRNSELLSKKELNKVLIDCNYISEGKRNIRIDLDIAPPTPEPYNHNEYLGNDYPTHEHYNNNEYLGNEYPTATREIQEDLVSELRGEYSNDNVYDGPHGA